MVVTADELSRDVIARDDARSDDFAAKHAHSLASSSPSVKQASRRPLSMSLRPSSQRPSMTNYRHT